MIRFELKSQSNLDEKVNDAVSMDIGNSVHELRCESPKLIILDSAFDEKGQIPRDHLKNSELGAGRGPAGMMPGQDVLGRGDFFIQFVCTCSAGVSKELEYAQIVGGARRHDRRF